MDSEFWHERWERDEIGFHKHEVNQLMKANIGQLGLSKGSHVLVPLCGKSLDLLWLVRQGFCVSGIELSAKAIEDFFSENDLKYEREAVPNGTVYRSGALTLWCADIFHFDPGLLGRVNAVYDRAALVALPPDMRRNYTAWLLPALADHTPILLITLDYPQQEMGGPPFAVAREEVRDLYGQYAEIVEIHTHDVLPDEPRWREKGVSRMIERVYRITTGTG